MQHEIIELLKDKTSIPNNLLGKILRVGVHTGSTAYGGVLPESANDIDYIIPPNCGISFRELALDNFVYTEGYRGEEFEFESCYVKTESGKILNLIIMQEEKMFAQWKKATEICIEMCRSSEKLKGLLKEKKNRVALFEFLKTFGEGKGD